MKIDFHAAQIPCLQFAVCEASNTEQAQELRLGDGYPDVGKILGAWGQLTIRGKEWRGDCVQISGGVTVWVLYVPEDGSQPVTQDVWVPFQMKWALPENTPEGNILIQPLIRFVDARSVSARKMMLRVGIGAFCCAAVSQEQTVYSPEKIPDGIQLLKSVYPVRLMQEMGEKTFQLEDTVGGGLSSGGKIVYYQLRPDITEQKVLTNKIAFRGNGNLHLLYQDEDGSLTSMDYPLSFSQFADLDRSYGTDAQLAVQLAVTNLEVEPDGEGHFSVKAGLLAQYLLDDRTLIETVEDAYSPGREMSAEQTELLLPAILDRRSENVVAEQTIAGKGTQIADISFLPDFPRQYREQGSVVMEVPGTIQLLYYGEDGNLRGSSSRWEGKKTLDSDASVKMIATPASIPEPQASFGTDTVGLRSDLSISLTCFGGSGIQMVTGLSISEDEKTDENRPSLILSRAGKDGLWKLAKKSGSTMDAIRKVNHLETEPRAGQMLLIPVIS